MKKILTTLLMVGMLTMMFSSCSGKPSGMSDNVYDACKKMIDVADQYIDAEITINEADDKMEVLEKRLTNLNGLVEEEAKAKAVSLTSAISMAEFHAISSPVSQESFNEIQNARNELAELIKYKN